MIAKNISGRSFLGPSCDRQEADRREKPAVSGAARLLTVAIQPFQPCFKQTCLLIFLLAAALACAGCVGGSRRAAAADATPRVAPLTEPEFDRFAGRLTERIEALLAEENYDPPPTILGPRVARNAAEEASVAQAFAGALGDGLNDRLGGVAHFAEALAAEPDFSHVPPGVGSAPAAPRLKAAVEFAATGNAPQRLLTFVLFDESAQKELLRESLPYEGRAGPPTAAGATPAAASALPPPSSSAPPASAKPPAAARGAERSGERVAKKPAAAKSRSDRAAKTPRDAPKKRKISIDDDERDLLTLLNEQAPYLREQTIAQPEGRLVFLNNAARERFRLSAQRAARTTDNRLRLELDVRARDRKRDAELRVVFLDAQDRAVEVTPVLLYRFLPSYTTTVTIIAGGPQAVRYICLFQ